MRNRETLSRKKDLARLFQAGRRYRGLNISFRVLQVDDRDCLRWVVAIASKEGNAVVRNRCKRVCRDVLYPLLPRIRNGYHIALVIRRQFAAMKRPEREDALKGLLARAGLLEQTKREKREKER